MAATSTVLLNDPWDGMFPFIPEAVLMEELHTIEEGFLKDLRCEEDFAVPGGTLHTENYLLPASRGAVVMIHGYTESAAKLRELVYYFLKSGLSVFSYDHRGHGHSLRQTDEIHLIHVDRFDDYVDDLDSFCQNYVRPKIGNVPLYLFGHSMGGAVAAHYVIDHPDTFSKAVLSSPMVCPAHKNQPLVLWRLMTGWKCLTGSAKKPMRELKAYNAETDTVECSCSTSRARFDFYKVKRAADPYLQFGGPSFRWINESVRQRQALLSSRQCAKIKAKVMLCQAGLDNVVSNEDQDSFIALVPGGRKERFEMAKHEIYNSTDDMMKPYVETLLNFYLKD